MLAAERLREVLARLPTVPNVTGYWARAVTAEYLSGPPHGESGGPQPLWTGGPVLSGARYTPRGGAPALYLAETTEIACLEIGATLAMGGRKKLAGAAPTVLFTVDVCVRDALDLCDPAIQQALGTNPQELTGNWRLAAGMPTQVLGEFIAAAGRFDALLAPSSKSAEGRILVVFAERLAAARGTYCSIVQGGTLAQRIP